MSDERLNYKLSNILQASTPERIDYKHFASKYTYGTGQDGANWTKAELKILLDEINRCYERLDKANEAMLTAREVLMKHHEWMSVNDATSEEDDQEILDVVKDLREASE